MNILHALLMTLLLATGRTGYYEGLRQFYNRETRSEDDPLYRVLVDTSNSDQDGFCVFIKPYKPDPKPDPKPDSKPIVDIQVNPNACNESTLFPIL